MGDVMFDFDDLEASENANRTSTIAVAQRTERTREDPSQSPEVLLQGYPGFDPEEVKVAREAAEYDAIFDVHVYERERVSQRVCWDLGVSVVLCACAVCAGLTDTVADSTVPPNPNQYTGPPM